MKDKELDQHIINAANKGEIPFDPAHYEQFGALLKAEKKRKKRRIIFWSFSTIGIALLSMVLFDPGQMVDQPASNAINNLNTVEENKNEVPVTNSTSNKDKTNRMASIPSIKNEQTALPERSDKIENRKELPADDHLQGNNIDAPATKRKNTIPTIDDHTLSNTAKTPNTPQQVKAIEKTPSLQPTKEIAKSMIEKPATNEENTIQDQVMETSNEKVVAQTEDASAKNPLQETPILDKVAKPANVKEKPVASKDNLWKLLVYGGPQLNQKNLAITNDQGTAQRKEIETAVTSIDVGIAVDRKIGKFNITGGFNYFNVRENYSFPDQVDTTLEIQDNSFWTVVDNGFWKYTDSILVQNRYWVYTDSIRIQKLDSTYNEDIDTTTIRDVTAGAKGNNIISSVSIPLLIGYEFELNKKFTLGVQTGVGIQYLLSSKGKTIDAEGNINSTDRVYRLRQWNYNWLFGMSLDYLFYDRFFLGFQPALRMPLRSQSSDKDVNLKNATYSFRARVGITF